MENIIAMLLIALTRHIEFSHQNQKYYKYLLNNNFLTL